MGRIACDSRSSHLGFPGVREQSLPPVLGEIECWTPRLPAQRDTGRIVRGSTARILGGKVCGKKVGGGKDTGVAQKEEPKLDVDGARLRYALEPYENLFFDFKTGFKNRFKNWFSECGLGNRFKCDFRVFFSGNCLFPRYSGQDQVRPVLVLLLSFSVFFGTGYATLSFTCK